jgi:hypothetical protein
VTTFRHLPEISARKKENDMPMIIINRCDRESLEGMFSGDKAGSQNILYLETI